MIIVPHVSYRHPVLCEGARLIGADAGGGAERLDALQILHQTVPLSQSLRRQGEHDLTAAVGQHGRQVLRLSKIGAVYHR